MTSHYVNASVGDELIDFRSKVVPLSDLCIRPRKAVWALYIDVVCINYDGNAFDCAVLAVMAALKSGKSSCTGGTK